MGEIFYPFSTLEDIQGDYLSYVESFQQIKSQEIKDCIEAPQIWLEKYGNLLSDVQFYFLDEMGNITRLN